MKSECPICPHRCSLDEGRTGLCGARKNTGGKISCENYGRITSIALDPIEKKPLKEFHPGSYILSVGSYGCNLRCPFCQNHQISMPDGIPDATCVTPENLIENALSLKTRGNIGIAYTYNEPLVGYEYVMDCAKLARTKGLKNVLVTNGYINEKPLIELLPYIDAMNIDLKSFSSVFYQKLGGDTATVKRTISLSADFAHVEVTTLIIPGENDSKAEIDNLASWLSGIGRDIPLHISRFVPRHLYSGKAPTPVDTVYSLAEIARKHLSRVYSGNC